jgi:hypothetical protein
MSTRDVRAFVFLVCCVTVLPAKTNAQASNGGSSRPHYDMTVRIVPDAKRISVSGTVRLPPAAEPRPQITLLLASSMGELKLAIVDSTRGATPVTAIRSEADGQVRWTIKPSTPFAAGEQPIIQFAYGGSGEVRPVFFIAPEVSVASGNSTAWFPQIERDPRGTARLQFDVPTGMTVVTGGVARTSHGQPLEFDAPYPSYLSFAAGRFTSRSISAGTRTIHGHFLERSADRDPILRNCARVLAALEDEFGRAPYESMAVVEVPAELGAQAGFEGASTEGMLLVTSGVLAKSFNTAFYGHELAHQWWGVSVGRTWWDSAGGRYLLDEALAQFGSLRAVEAIEGPAAAERYRKYGHPGYIDFHSAAGFFMVNAAGLDQPLLNLPNGEVARILADSKGFLFYSMLGDLVGRAALGQALSRIAEEYRFQSLSWTAFQEAVSQRTGQTLASFFEQWLTRTGAPEWSAEWKQRDRQLTLQVRQRAPSFRIRVPVVIEGAHLERIVDTIELDGETTTLVRPVTFNVSSVRLDPEFRVLHWTEEFVELRPALRAYGLAHVERQQGKLKEAEARLNGALRELPRPDRHGSAFLVHMGLGQLLLGSKREAEARDHLLLALRQPTRRAELLPWLYFYLASAAKRVGDESQYRDAVEHASGAELLLGVETGAAAAAALLDAPRQAISESDYRFEESYWERTRHVDVTVHFKGDLAAVRSRLTRTWFESRHERARSFDVRWISPDGRQRLRLRWTRNGKECAESSNEKHDLWKPCAR